LFEREAERVERREGDWEKTEKEERWNEQERVCQ